MMNNLLSKFSHVVNALLCALAIGIGHAYAESINVFTWEGYVQPEEVEEVNKLLKDKGYDYDIKVIEPWAEGPEQMFKIFRSGVVDISFLTLNYLQLQGGKQANLLRAINVDSPRLSNYKYLSKALTNIPMGMKNGQPLYIPFGGGAYGIWANLDKVKQPPESVKDLWAPQWKGKLSLTKGQIQPNIALALIALDKPPFYLNELANDRIALLAISAEDGELQQKLNALYAQVDSFWDAGPEFNDNLLLVASYGIGAFMHNAKGNNWGLVNFKEGNTVWLDTINFSAQVTGRKLEAAEIFANYFIGKAVQDRVVNGLGMVAASSLVSANPLLVHNPDFFSQIMFWPPYDKKADNMMKVMSDRAMK